MATSIELLENSVYNINIIEYHHNQEYDFRNKTTLYKELIKPTISVQNIIKWEYQIMECIKNDYLHFNECPENIDPKTIILDNNKDIICHSVVFSRCNNNIAYQARYIDCLTRIHCTLFQYINVRNRNNIHSKKLRILRTIGIYFNAAAASISHKDTVIGTCNLIEQLYEMVDFGIIDDLYSTISR